MSHSSIYFHVNYNDIAIHILSCRNSFWQIRTLIETSRKEKRQSFYTPPPYLPYAKIISSFIISLSLLDDGTFFASFDNYQISEEGTFINLVPIILVDVEENSGLSYDKVLFELTEEQKEWELKIGMRVQIVCSDVFQESLPPIGKLISITEAAPIDE